MGFNLNREIVAGNTLIAEAIQSQNYVPGTSGWIIEADGDAEFNNLTVRGEFYVSATNGAYIHLFNSGGVPISEYQPPNRAGWVYSQGHILVTDDANKPYMQVQSPGTTSDGFGGPYGQSSIYLYGESHFQSRQIFYDADVHLFGPTKDIRLFSDKVTVGNPTGVNPSNIIIGNSVAGATTEIVTPATIIDGVLTAANRLVGTVSILPSASNVPTSLAIVFPTSLKGTSFNCQVTPNTSVPGTTVTGVSYTALTANGVTLWLTRSGSPVSTNLSYTVEGF